MKKYGKKHRQAMEIVSKASVNSWKDALDLVVKTATAKFDESVDAHIILGVDASKSEQTVRGSVLLPNGTGKKVRVLVFAKGEHEDQAKKAGADFVGLDDIIEKILGGWMEFDVAVATPDVMGQVGRVAKVLGPRGLLPNKKIGTVTFDIAGIVSDLKQGRVSFRNDKGGVVHAPFGRISQGTGKLIENLNALVKAVSLSRPATAKGKFVKKITVSSTMGVGLTLSADNVN